jgi:hypothetical protein
MRPGKTITQNELLVFQISLAIAKSVTVRLK